MIKDQNPNSPATPVRFFQKEEKWLVNSWCSPITSQHKTTEDSSETFPEQIQLILSSLAITLIKPVQQI